MVLWFSRFGLVVLGYLAAVIGATAVTVIAMFVTGLVAEGANVAGLLKNLRQIPETLLIGMIITVQSALPGFLIAISVAAMLRWVKPLSYTLAGGLNGAFSILVLNFFTGTRLFVMPPGLLIPCVIGGLAGGFVFYFVGIRRIRNWSRTTA
ncbi:MAG TPA: hypothetical protein VGV39_26270 [Mesorhizobium sp.]|jgi:hypothetical protein|uniref:hypothetical protein n=1 Tax=Mesorhizobium sp. TaxID=1871066 RepID=UPI002DDCDA36|nr:hypothetical protein [Mesorhizobium sp.]HEV2506607.1 hypothetical protein [Mesorhizobium sp.]